MGEFPRKPDELTAAWLAAALGRPCTALRWERIGEDYGLASTVARVWSGAETVVVKWPTVEDGANETAFLREIAPGVPKLPVPRLLFSEVGADAAVVVYEDLHPARQGDCLVGATAEEAGRVLDAVAELHAAWWGRTDESAASRYADWTKSTARHRSQIGERAPRCMERMGHVVPSSVHALVGDLRRQMELSIAALSGRTHTLVHNDLHFDNVFVREGGAPVILDWPAVRRGPAVIDFEHVLVEALLPDARRAHTAALAARYIAALRRGGVRDYDEEQLLRDTRHVHVLLLGGAICWGGMPEADPRSRSPRVAAVVENIVRNTASALET